MQYENIRKTLNDFYFNELTTHAELIQKRVFAKMDEYDKAHPNQSVYQLKAKLYESIAEEIMPTLFPDIPFYFETGALRAHSDGKFNRGGLHANGWLYIRNEHLFRDFDQQAFEAYFDDLSAGLYTQTGSYVDIMHFGIPMQKLFSVGLKGIIAEIEEALSTEKDKAKREFLHCAAAGIKALRTIQLKFAYRAKEQGSFSLADMAERTPWEPPKTFHEGLCVMAFMRKALGALEGVGFNSFGRVDVLLAPLYEADIQRGVEKEELYKLVCKFLLIWDCTLDKTKIVDDPYEQEKENTLTLGGCDEKGGQVFNEVTKMFILARNSLDIIYPKMMLRFSSFSSREYIQLISQPLLEGKSFSLFQNDDSTIPALINVGVSEEDAANYIVGGCWDVITPEVSNKFSGTYFFLLKPLEWLVSQDYENFEKRGLSCEGFESLPTFEKVYEAYVGYLKQLLLRRATLMAQGARVWSQVSPLCALSALMQPCIPNRLDVTAGGGKYNQESVYFSCFGDTVDSLLVIKKLCFDEKICSLAQLLEECRNNWKNEELRQKAMDVCSYGDGSEESSQFAARFFNELAEYACDLPTAYGGKHRIGSNQYTEVLFYGKTTVATPNGRRTGDYLSMGLSPSRFQKPVTVTEILESLRYINIANCAGNTSLTVTLPVGKINGEQMIDFFYGAAKSNAQGLQFNCVSREMLLDAQKHPENYRHLIVRVCGFSMYFVLLSKEYQNEFISRLSAEYQDYEAICQD